MHHACFLLGTWQFSVFKWNGTHSICWMGRIQGTKMNISQCCWFCYSALSSENISKHPLQVAFLRRDPLQLRPRIKATKGIQEAHALFFFFLCIVHKQNYYFHFLGLLPANSLPLQHVHLFLILQHHGIVYTLFSVCCPHPRTVSWWRRWEAPRLLGSLCHGGFWHVTKCSDVWGSALPSSLQAAQPASRSATQTLRTSPALCLRGSPLSLLIHLWNACAFCRQRGGGGWQGRWRTGWYTVGI